MKKHGKVVFIRNDETPDDGKEAPYEAPTLADLIAGQQTPSTEDDSSGIDTGAAPKPYEPPSLSDVIKKKER